MKILLTGGHLTPAYAFSEVALSHGDQLLMIGSTQSDSPERNEFMQLGVGYQYVDTVKFNRYKKLRSFLLAPTLLISIGKALRIIHAFKPNVVVTFGSYNAVPVALAARLTGIPFITHEQTRSIGLANKLMAPLATTCVISYPESRLFFPKNKTVLLGNILRRDIWHPPKQWSLAMPSNRPIIYITGGNQGSATITDAVTSLLPYLVNQYQIVIQHGKVNLRISDANKPFILAKPWFSANEASWLYHHAHIVISRAGANTIAELMVAGAPAIIIPLEGSAGNEQTHNATIFSSRQAGILIPQQQCTQHAIKDAIEIIESSYERYKEKAQQLVSLQNPLSATKLYEITKNIVKVQ